MFLVISSSSNDVLVKNINALLQGFSTQKLKQVYEIIKILK